jgi:hypothetical protein
MSTDDGSSASQDSNGSAEENQSGNQSTQIKPEDHMRAIDDLKKFKAQSREWEAKFNMLSKEIEEQKNLKLTESNDYKSLYEQASQKNKDWESKYSRLKDSVAYNERYKAAQKALIDAGIKKEALKILDKEDLESIIVEYTTEGRTLTNGVEEFVDAFKKNYGTFAFENKTPARVNGGGGNASQMFDGKMTTDKIYEIEKKHGVRSDQYRAAIEQYKKQKTV